MTRVSLKPSERTTFNATRYLRDFVGMCWGCDWWELELTCSGNSVTGTFPTGNQYLSLFLPNESEAEKVFARLAAQLERAKQRRHL